MQQLKNIGHFFETHFWRFVYGVPDKGLMIYGVTGTNGKTTTCYLLASVLAAAYGKESVGMLTTVAFRIGNEEEINTSKMTTLPSRKIFAYLARMKRAGVTYVVLETTSHALDQHRISGIQLDGAIILNISREHLDYHKTIASYAAAKEKIVNYLRIGAPLIGKQDDEYVRAMLNRAEGQGMNVHRITKQEVDVATTQLAGSINKENAAAVIALARALHISDDAITSGINQVTKVPGRMETIVVPQGFTVIIDYAVTPDALDRLYSDTKKTLQPGTRILGTLSAAGLRDRGKRPDMARAVAKYADRIIVTREDPWTEPEEQIFQDLEEGLMDTAVSWERIVDRKQALKKLLEEAKPGDVVIATGKGAERGMGIGKDIIPWNEREIIEELVKNL